VQELANKHMLKTKQNSEIRIAAQNHTTTGEERKHSTGGKIRTAKQEVSEFVIL
jgi:hypothetical protein